MSGITENIPLGPFSVLKEVNDQLDRLSPNHYTSSEENRMTQLLIKTLTLQKQEIIDEVIRQPRYLKIVGGIHSKLESLRDIMLKNSSSSLPSILRDLTEIESEVNRYTKRAPLLQSTHKIPQNPTTDSTVLRFNAAQEAIQKDLFLSIDSAENLSLRDYPQDDDRQMTIIELSDINEDTIKNLKSSQIVQLLQKAITTPLPGLTAYVINLLQKPGDIRESFLSFVDKNPDTCEHLLLTLTAHYDSNILGIFKLLINQCHFPITTQLALKTLHYQNLPMLHFIFEKTDHTWKEKNAQAILTTLLQTLDPHSAAIVFEHIPDLGKKCPLILIKKAMDDGKSDFIRWMLDRGKRISSKELVRLIKTAVQLGDLSLMRLLCQTAQNKKNKHKIFYENNSYPEILGLKKLSGSDKKQDRFEMLFHFALNSPMEEVYRIVQSHPEWADVLPDVIKRISLLVRLPKDCRSEVNKKFINEIAYEGASAGYALENLQFIRKIVPRMSAMKWDDFLEAIVSDRFLRNSQLNPLYGEKAINLHPIIEPTTPLISCEKRENEEIVEFNRYYRSLKHLSGSMYNPKARDWHAQTDSSVKGGSIKELALHKTDLAVSPSIDFTYPVPSDTSDHIEHVVLTRLNFHYPELTWNHANSLNLEKTKDTFDQLFRELLEYSLNPGDRTSMELFSDKVARAYKLVATRCEMLRGTPHNALMFLIAIFLYHHLPPPISKLEHFFSDNSMLMMPLEEIINKWETFFESTWDQALVSESDEEGRKSVKDLLKRNPELLNFASVAVRTDPECIAICMKK